MSVRAPGRVFTPPAFAEQLWRAAAAHVRGEQLTVADPAAGVGALLAPALHDPRVTQAWATELDALNVESMRSSPPSAGEHAALHLRHADALTLSWGSDAPTSLQAQAHGAAAPSDLASTPLVREGWADIVIANPPYLRETGNARVFRALREWHNEAWRPWYRKDADLHHFFWALGARWLRPGGVLALLVPAYGLDSEAATPVRRHLAREGAVRGIWRAGDARVFPDASVEAAVVLWEKGASERTAVRLGATLEPCEGTVAIHAGGAPWRWHADALPALEGPSARIGDIFCVSEGVSTGANRLRARDVERIEQGSAGEGIFVLRDHELARLALPQRTLDRFVRRRRSASGAREWVIVARDGDLPCLDAGELDPEHPGLSAHLSRFRPVLAARAEMRRNPGRSWYALAWARHAEALPAIVTPKWSEAPAFDRLAVDEVAMTDHRVLTPRAPMDSALLDRWVHALRSEDAAARFRALLKRKGKLLEFYGASFEEVALPVTRVEYSDGAHAFVPRL